MKVLILGAGSIGRRHMANIAQLSKCTQFLLLKTSGSQADLEDEYNVAFVTSLASVREGDVDFAVISSPSYLHAEAVCQLINKNIPFYIEKPLCISFEELERIRSLLAEDGSYITSLMGCNLRFLPSIVELRKLINSGAIGRVVRASFQVGQWLPDWRSKDYRQTYSADSEKGGGVFLDLIHEIDVANWLFGPFVSMSSAKSNRGILEIEAEECATALLVSEGGSIVTVSMDYISRKPVRCYEIVGEKGTLVWSFSDRELKLITANSTEILMSGGAAFDMNQTYISAMSELMDAVKYNKPTSFGVEGGLDSMGLALTLKETTLL